MRATLKMILVTWLVVKLFCLFTFLCSQKSSPHSSQYVLMYNMYRLRKGA